MSSPLTEATESRRPAFETLAKPSSPVQWLALYTMPRHEKRLAQLLTLRQIECFLPLYSTQRRWKDGSRVTLELPLFPGYLFVRIAKCVRFAALSLPGAIRYVTGHRSEPMALSDEEIETLRSGLNLRRAVPHPLLVAGSRARIRTGALAGMEGVIVRWKNRLRVVLTLDFIMQSVAVEVNGDELDPVDGEDQDHLLLAG